MTAWEVGIRQETPEDYARVGEVVYRAFAVAGDFTVADYLTELRKKETFIPSLSFVAARPDGEIVGRHHGNDRL